MFSKSRPGYSTLTERLEAQIASGVYRGGDRLPPLRVLSEEFELTEYAVHQGLKRLQEKGLIVLRHGSGAYVADYRDEAVGCNGWNITVFVGAEPIGMGYLACAMMGIQESAMRHGCSLTMRKRDYYQYYAPQPPLETVLGDADGVIFLGEYDYLPLTFPNRIPAVGIEMSSTCGGAVSPVSLDPIASAELAVDYFRRKKKKYVEIHYLEGGPVFEWRAECFRHLWQRHGTFAMRPYPLNAAHTIVPATDLNTGMLFCSGSWCEDYLRAFRRLNGADMTRKFAVLSIDGKSALMPGFLPVSNISIDWRAAGEVAFAELLRRLQHPSTEARRIYLVPRLRELEKRDQ